MDDNIIITCGVISKDVSRTGIERSTYFRDYLNYQCNNTCGINIPFPQQYCDGFDHYVNYCNMYFLKPTNIKLQLSLCHYLEDNTYFILLLQDLLLLPNFKHIIDSLLMVNTNLHDDIYRYLPSSLFYNSGIQQHTSMSMIQRNMDWITLYNEDGTYVKWKSNLSLYQTITVNVARFTICDVTKDQDVIQQLYTCYPWLTTIIKSFNNHVINNETFLANIHTLTITFIPQLLPQPLSSPSTTFNITTNKSSLGSNWDHNSDDDDDNWQCNIHGKVNDDGEPQICVFEVNIGNKQYYNKHYEIYKTYDNKQYVYLCHKKIVVDVVFGRKRYGYITKVILCHSDKTITYSTDMESIADNLTAFVCGNDITNLKQYMSHLIK